MTLEPLVSDTINLPLVTYPEALKLAGKYINEGNLNKAKEVLVVAMSSFVNVTKITPIPLLKTTELMVQAEKMV